MGKQGRAENWTEEGPAELEQENKEEMSKDRRARKNRRHEFKEEQRAEN
jgi:hypothetical protein